jgi:UPF0716 protein FxsA
MFSRPALAVFALVLVEIVVARAAAQQIGLRAVVVVMVIALLAGLAILRRQLPALVQDGARHLVEADGSAGFELVQRGLLATAGLLVAVPGLLTTTLGVILLVPPIRALAARRLRPSLARSFPLGFTVPFSASSRFPRRRDVVDVDVVTDDTRKSARPELN